jgi:peptide/nickel transport system substrate-binding protein
VLFGAILYHFAISISFFLSICTEKFANIFVVIMNIIIYNRLYLYSEGGKVMKLKTFTVLLTVFTLLLTAAAFGGTQKEVTPPGKEPLIIGTTDKLSGDIDPAEAYDFHTWELFRNVSRGLLAYKIGTTELTLGLAAEWPTVSANGLEYTFKLKRGVKFSDGTPFNADVVKHSIDRVIKLQGDPSWLVISFVKEVQVLGEYTVKFVLKNAVGFFPALVASVPYFPVSPDVYPMDQIVAEPENYPALGPYMVKSLIRDVELVLVANPNFYGSNPKEETVIIKYFADATSMRLAVENGEIDIAWKTLNPADIEDLATKSNLNMIEAKGAYIRYLCFVTDTAPANSELVRQGVSYALDREAIARLVFFNQVDPLFSMVPNGMWGHIDAFGKYDPQKARQILARAGYNRSNPLEVPLWWTPTHYGDTEQDVASVLKDSMEKTGVIKVTLQSAEWASYVDNFDRHNMLLFLLGWYPDYIDPDNYTAAFAQSGPASDGLGIFLNDPRMDRLLDTAARDPEQSNRVDHYRKVQEYWTEAVPTVPLFQGKLYLATQTNISGIKVSPTMVLYYETIEKR